MSTGQTKSTLNSCINEFQCKTCPVEKEFFEDMRLVIAEFRSSQKSVVAVHGLQFTVEKTVNREQLKIRRQLFAFQ